MLFAACVDLVSHILDIFVFVVGLFAHVFVILMQGGDVYPWYHIVATSPDRVHGCQLLFEVYESMLRVVH